MPADTFDNIPMDVFGDLGGVEARAGPRLDTADLQRSQIRFLAD